MSLAEDIRTVEIELGLSKNGPDYAMFTDLGNAAVDAIVVTARENNLTWAQVLRALRTLAERDAFGEAMDTMVRECVFDALDFGRRGESFYGA